MVGHWPSRPVRCPRTGCSGCCDWDIDGVRDDVRDYVVEYLGDRDGVLIVDDTGFLKKGVRSAGVLSTKVNDTVITADGAQARADVLIAGLPPRAWRRLSAGAGAHGPREYDWARVPIRVGWRAGLGHWLLARRSITKPSEIAYYICYGPRRCGLHDLAWIAGSRWRIEECFQQAKNEAGLDEYQVRSWRAWYAHITLSMLAHAWLAVSRSVVVKGEPVPTNQT
jgi:DDE superfamily endonuclease